MTSNKTLWLVRFSTYDDLGLHNSRVFSTKEKAREFLIVIANRYATKSRYETVDEDIKGVFYSRFGSIDWVIVALQLNDNSVIESLFTDDLWEGMNDE